MTGKLTGTIYNTYLYLFLYLYLSLSLSIYLYISLSLYIYRYMRVRLRASLLFITTIYMMYTYIIMIFICHAFTCIACIHCNPYLAAYAWRTHARTCATQTQVYMQHAWTRYTSAYVYISASSSNSRSRLNSIGSKW